MGKYNLSKQRLVDAVIIDSLDDLPAAVGGVITLEDKHYILNRPLSSPSSLAWPGDGKRATWEAVNRAAWTFTGTTACWLDPAAAGDVEIFGLTQFEAPTADMFDCATSGGVAASWQAQGGTRLTNMNGIGHIQGPNFAWNIFFGTISDFDTGFDVEDADFFEVNTNFVLGNNATTTVFDVHGTQTTGPINFILISATVGSNETFLNLNPDIKKTVNSIFLQSNQSFGPVAGQRFKAGSLTQIDPIVNAQGNAAFPNSTVKAKLDITGNTNVTDIVTQNVAVPINALWTDGTIEERLCFRDDVTFDNTTNTMTSFNNIASPAAAFNHGLENGEIITFQSDGGLPTEILTTEDYFIINKTATTFQVSLTSGGAAVTFSTDGTTPNYYDHITGSSVTGWVVYIGLADTSVVVQGWVGLDKSGTAHNCGTQVIKTDTSFVETNQARGSNVVVQQGKGQSSTVSDIVNLKTGEGIKVYVENRELNDDITVVDADLTFNLA